MTSAPAEHVAGCCLVRQGSYAFSASPQVLLMWPAKQCIPTPDLLKYNWHIKLYKFKVYNVLIWYTYVLQNDYFHSIS